MSRRVATIDNEDLIVSQFRVLVQMSNSVSTASVACQRRTALLAELAIEYQHRPLAIGGLETSGVEEVQLELLMIGEVESVANVSASVLVVEATVDYLERLLSVSALERRYELKTWYSAFFIVRISVISTRVYRIL